MNSIPEKMKALVAYAPGEYRLEMIPTPKAEADDVIMRVEGCGICAGDVKAFAGAPIFWGGDGNPPHIKAPMVCLRLVPPLPRIICANISVTI